MARDVRSIKETRTISVQVRNRPKARLVHHDDTLTQINGNQCPEIYKKRLRQYVLAANTVTLIAFLTVASYFS